MKKERIIALHEGIIITFKDVGGNKVKGILEFDGNAVDSVTITPLSVDSYTNGELGFYSDYDNLIAVPEPKLILKVNNYKGESLEEYKECMEAFLEKNMDAYELLEDWYASTGGLMRTLWHEIGHWIDNICVRKTGQGIMELIGYDCWTPDVKVFGEEDGEILCKDDTDLYTTNLNERVGQLILDNIYPEDQDEYLPLFKAEVDGENLPQKAHHYLRRIMVISSYEGKFAYDEIFGATCIPCTMISHVDLEAAAETLASIMCGTAPGTARDSSIILDPDEVWLWEYDWAKWISAHKKVRERYLEGLEYLKEKILGLL